MATMRVGNHAAPFGGASPGDAVASSQADVHLVGSAAAEATSGAAMTYDIFISYRRADRELVASVVRRLEERGVGVWYDAEIEGGADWRETIVDALTNSDMLAIFFSEDCNNSRQLKKELAVADTLRKPVVPILIENTQPRGAYLYELADRNWIQMWPEPMDRIEELVEHLAVLAGKSDGGLAGARPSKTLAPVAANDAAPAPAAAANEDEQNLDEALGEFIEEAEQPTRSAPKMAKAYIGRVTDPGPVRKMNDVPPFRWIDLVFLVPAWIAVSAWVISEFVNSPLSEDYIAARAALYCIVATAAYGAVVFPARYYLRRRPVVEALVKYVGSAAMLFVAGAGFVLVGLRDGYMNDADVMDFLEFFGIAWAAFAVVAFAVYGVLAGQRAIRSFRSNIRKL
jgi:hypothetical protein